MAEEKVTVPIQSADPSTKLSIDGTNGLTNGVSDYTSQIQLNPTLARVVPEPVEAGTVLEGVSQKVFLDRYALKDEKGKAIEQYPEQMARRVARAISAVEAPSKQKEWEENFYWAMQDFKFVPGGRILSGAGTGFFVTYYNCYVLPSPQDSRGGILENLKEMVEIMSRGGGVGVNLSSLRPRGSRVKKVNGFSSGPMSWAELYSVATHDIIQQGGTRRGALMLMLWDWHPDIEEFVTVKRDLTKIVGANLSVCASDKFMEQVAADGDWDLVFPDTVDPDYDRLWDGILDHWVALGKRVEVYKTIKARRLWDLICEAAWASAEPGFVFMERYNKEHSNSYFNTINCVNPCGEEGLPAYGVCNLGSINLVPFVDELGQMDYEGLAEHAKLAVRFLDNVIEGDIYLFEGIRQTQLNGERRVGLGTMGLGDALIKMKVRYGCEQSLPIVEKIYRTIRDAAFEASADLAAEKGPFPKFDAQKYLAGPFIRRLPGHIRAKIAKQGIRNSVLLMQAPTGSTSLMAAVTSGIEPVYEFSFIRRDRLGEHKIYHSLYQKWLEEHPGQTVPDYFVSTSDLTSEDHVRVQAAVQKYVDASISKTVNAPNSHTVEDVKKLYTLAYELGLKGIAYMRDGSRPGALSRESEVGPAPPQATAPGSVLSPRPEVLRGATYRMVTPVGSAFITINDDQEGNPVEVFVSVGKAGSDLTAMATALGRMLSAILRTPSQISPRTRAENMIEQLSGIGGRRSVGFGTNRVHSLPDAVAQALARHLGVSIGNGNGKPTLQAGAVMAAHNNPDPTLAPAEDEISRTATAGTGTFDGSPAEDEIPDERPMATGNTLAGADICPRCGVAALVWEEGCSKCYSCGHAEC